jgi:membrane protein implicated in regulation of membrane protease activity
MKLRNSIDFTQIDWSKLDREKSEFIYNEAVARLDSIHKNIDGITNKALGMLSFAMPVLTALVGFFLVQWGSLSTALFSASVCAVVFLFAILVLLLLILLPRGVNSAQGEPETYFTDGYYLNNMDAIYKGNIQALQTSINEDRTVLNMRGKLFRAAIVLLAAFPLAASVVMAVTSIVAK